MTPTLLFAGFSVLMLIIIASTAYFYRKVGPSTILGLFAFGALMSVPFVLIECFGEHMNYFYVVATFLLIELGTLFFEHRIAYFHELVHHNIKKLRIASFLLIGLGFTYAEISYAIMHNHDIIELLNTIPFRATYALLMHTVFASAASLVQIGKQMTNEFQATLLKAIAYYIRIAIISFSHFLYVFSVEHNLMLLIGSLLVIGVFTFFQIKKLIDFKLEIIE
jgi:hypothetical protein